MWYMMPPKSKEGLLLCRIRRGKNGGAAPFERIFYKISGPSEASPAWCTLNFHGVTQIRCQLSRSSFIFLLHGLSYISMHCPSISLLKTPWLIIWQYERLLLVKIFCLSFCPSSLLWQICPSYLWKLSIATWSLLVWMTSSQLIAESIQLTTHIVISGL